MYSHIFSRSIDTQVFFIPAVEDGEIGDRASRRLTPSRRIPVEERGGFRVRKRFLWLHDSEGRAKGEALGARRGRDAVHFSGVDRADALHFSGAETRNKRGIERPAKVFPGSVKNIQKRGQIDSEEYTQIYSCPRTTPLQSGEELPPARREATVEGNGDEREGGSGRGRERVE